ncbi:MAG: oxidoreductase [Fimbriimonadaceae bacterium]
MQRTWFITGCSAGFGRILVEQLLERGDKVIATARRQESVEDLNRLDSPNLIALPCDVTDRESINQAVEKGAAHFGGIDVLVNNAGYGYVSPIESIEEDALRQQYETNVFGLIFVTQAALPYIRASKCGYILNFSSIAGLTSGPCFGPYCSTKHAVEAISESLHAEMEPFGVKVTLIEPGLFRTRFANTSSIVTNKKVMPEYKSKMDDVLGWFDDVDGTQPGDPTKVTQAMIDLVEMENPPLRLLCGADAHERALKKLDRYRADFDRMKDVSCSMAFD